ISALIQREASVNVLLSLRAPSPFWARYWLIRPRNAVSSASIAEADDGAEPKTAITARIAMKGESRNARPRLAASPPPNVICYTPPAPPAPFGAGLVPERHASSRLMFGFQVARRQ